MNLKVGDIFTVPLNDNEVGFGQIVGIPDKSTLLIAIYELRQKKSESIDMSKIKNSKVVFLGFSLDAKLYHKHWLIVGNETSNLTNIKMPFNKLGTPPRDIFIVDYKGNKIREATQSEFENLNYQTTIAPVRYENALKAYHNLQEWKEEDYGKLEYKHTLHSNKVVAGNK